MVNKTIKRMSGPKFISSTTYSEVLDEDVYCTINRSLIAWKDYGRELRLLRSMHDANEHLEGYVASLN